MISRPTYATREDVKSAPDFKSTTYNNAQIDRAIQAAAENIDGRLHRKFYPEDTTKYFDWPNFGGSGGGWIAYPWRLWLDQHEVISITTFESPAGTTISSSSYFLEPVNSGPPYSYIELDRSSTAAFSAGTTPQHSIKITGTWGYRNDLDTAGTLAAAISSTSATTLNVSDASQMGIGDLIIIDSERILVQDRSTLTTTQTVVGTGINTAASNDNILAVTDGTKINLGEVLLIDAEKLLAVDITGNNVTVKRGYDGTNLATHSAGATVYAYRTLTVLRGQLGTTAATHSNAAPISRMRVPSLIRNLAIAEAVNTVLQETGGYSISQGEGQATTTGLGSGLADLWDEAMTRYGRKNRMRAI